MPLFPSLPTPSLPFTFLFLPLSSLFLPFHPLIPFPILPSSPSFPSLSFPSSSFPLHSLPLHILHIYFILPLTPTLFPSLPFPSLFSQFPIHPPLPPPYLPSYPLLLKLPSFLPSFPSLFKSSSVTPSSPSSSFPFVIIKRRKRSILQQWVRVSSNYTGRRGYRQRTGLHTCRIAAERNKPSNSVINVNTT